MALVNGYLSVAELRDVLRDRLTAHDSEYERAIGAASRQIDDYCGRFFWKTGLITRTFRAGSGGSAYTGTSYNSSGFSGSNLLWTSDIATTTGLIVKTDDDGDGVFETTWTIDTDFIMEPFELMNGRPYERIAAVGSKVFPVTTRTSRRPRVQVTGYFGWATVPDEIKQACSIVSVDHFMAKDLIHVASTYGNDVRIARDTTQGQFGRKVQFSRVRAPTLNPEAEAILSTLRQTVVA